MEALLEAVDPFPFVAGFVFNLPPGKDYPLRTPAAEVDPLPGPSAAHRPGAAR